MRKIIEKYFKSKINLNRELAGYIRTGTALGLVATVACVYLVAKELLERQIKVRPEGSEVIREIGALLVKVEVISTSSIDELGVLGALRKAVEEHEKS